MLRKQAGKCQAPMPGVGMVGQFRELLLPDLASSGKEDRVGSCLHSPGRCHQEGQRVLLVQDRLRQANDLVSPVSAHSELRCGQSALASCGIEFVESVVPSR